MGSPHAQSKLVPAEASLPARSTPVLVKHPVAQLYMPAGSLGRASWTLAAVCAATAGGIAYIHRGQRLEREVRPSCGAWRSVSLHLKAAVCRLRRTPLRLANPESALPLLAPRSRADAARRRAS